MTSHSPSASAERPVPVSPEGGSPPAQFGRSGWPANACAVDPFAPHAAASVGAEALRQLAALPFFRAGAFIELPAADNPPTPGAGPAALPGIARVGGALERAQLGLPPLLLEHARVLPQLLVSEGEWHACWLRGPGGRSAVMVMQALRELGELERRALDLFVRNLVTGFGRAPVRGSSSTRPLPAGGPDQPSMPGTPHGGANPS